MLRETNAKKTSILPIFLDEKERSSLPKISIKSVLSALQNEDLNELIPLYYMFIRKDLHLASELSNRRSQVASLSYILECEDKKQKEFIGEYLKTIDLPGLIITLLSSVAYGFAVVDMVYGDIPLAPKKFHLIHPRYFDYKSETKTLFIRQKGGALLDPELDPQKFLMHYHKLEGGELVDYGVMGQIIFTALLKHSVINSNMQYFDALGVPPIVVNADAQTDEQLKSMINQIQYLRSNSVGVFPKETVVELLEAKASKAEFLSFIKYCDALVSHYVIGATLSGGKEETGSHALGIVHDERRKDIMRTDARLLEEPINAILSLALTFNIASPKPFKFRFDIGDEKDEESLSRTYQNITASGYEIPEEHMAKSFGIEGIKLKTASPDAKAPAKNSVEKNAKTNPVDNLNPFLNPVETDIKEFLTALLTEANSFDEAFAVLSGVYPSLDFQTLTNLLEEGAMRMTIYGAAEAQTNA